MFWHTKEDLNDLPRIENSGPNTSEVLRNHSERRGTCFVNTSDQTQSYVPVLVRRLTSKHHNLPFPTLLNVEIESRENGENCRSSALRRRRTATDIPPRSSLASDIQTS
jgi:hypothetical protein